MVPWFPWFLEFVPGYLEMVPSYPSVVPGNLGFINGYQVGGPVRALRGGWGVWGSRGVL